MKREYMEGTGVGTFKELAQHLLNLSLAVLYTKKHAGVYHSEDRAS